MVSQALSDHRSIFFYEKLQLHLVKIADHVSLFFSFLIQSLSASEFALYKRLYLEVICKLANIC